MRRILFDADAFNCLRNMGLLPLLRPAPADPTPFVITEYVARHELCQVATDVSILERDKRLHVQPVTRRKSDPQGQRFRAFRDEGLDKGEAESLAWVMGLGEADRPLFISNDREARAGFRRHGAPVGDVMDLIVEVAMSGLVELAVVRELASAEWDERPNHRCRPGDYSDFDSTFKTRSANRP